MQLLIYLGGQFSLQTVVCIKTRQHEEKKNQFSLHIGLQVLQRENPGFLGTGSFKKILKMA
jgi:hypothetical protein